MVKDKKAIKRDILDKFRYMGNKGREALPPFWLELEYLPSLNGPEKRLCRLAVKDLIAQGLCSPSKKPAENLTLTEKGADLLLG